MGLIARRKVVAHRLEVNVVPIMRMSNREGLIHPGTKGISLKLADPRYDLNDMGHERAAPL
jgi:hypothetical protein